MKPVTSTGPLYHQTAEILRSRIVQNVWKQGDRLPSESQLCDELGVSSITMRRAVATLVAEGLLVRLQGKGTFVSSDHAIVQGPPQLTSFTEDMRLRGWQSSARVTGFRSERAPAGLATRLGLPAGALVHVLGRVRLADRLPVAVQTAYVPGLLFPDLGSHDFRRESLYEVFERDYGVKPATATEVYRASKLTDEEAALLETEPDSPAFRVERLTTDSTGRRVELVESVVRGDRYTLVLRLSASRQPGR
ncbi:MAG TPA: GntR family transcriptional regulator [Candidatus Eisenbacteria bacterium]|nr:GntR family transcriptional regulator [Candidatus Eisenbacteria bacterium]